MVSSEDWQSRINDWAPDLQLKEVKNRLPDGTVYTELIGEQEAKVELLSYQSYDYWRLGQLYGAQIGPYYYLSNSQSLIQTTFVSKYQIASYLSQCQIAGDYKIIDLAQINSLKIKDEAIKIKVADFIKQEAQHGIAHDVMNQVMIDQGIPVKEMVTFMKQRFDDMLKKRSPEYNIAMTAASEHLTALMAECFYSHKHTLADADPYVRALFAWHSIEEMEHRDVAFDVMQDVAKVPYNLRASALVITSMLMTTFTMYRANQMLKADGFNGLERANIFRKGLPWVFGKNGVLSAMKKPYMDWFKRDFHPSQHPVIAQYQVWLDTLAATDDPIKAGQAFWEAAK